ncbi:hypothetical protein COS81_01585 [candidate division WWE3 bacterium CG06_land_8_20_14_3_00_42_16]|uniref:Polymerase nucleotidyl transferase domain-containing protein n=4 Tax=Katanobacteria TaxID=422282 RepID=A0A2M7ANS6_UNCKA|nr:MAG: hypothetical protein COS81_01585 [candidate division WWE3 bacterium CG06_land_8_20_14_3_00_42_16]PIZ42609.1 MAG: hypothetical protein COY34_02625 [candidate division WWE3 bacterium CG_4_10_14_0_2_um_filter_42_8]PJA37667.1 MAG: hypothetical protein CO181_02565 [candidate division WWE3 bacterium CG_4_9_14_3_um_filter_43_9]PJC68828.1 MAG: hypothetical protein CO015_02580 [candidate division WWE3 bacterium CG_4_8_14_3_um_filter_42_11]
MDRKGNYRKVKQVINEFARELQKQIKVEKIILFGSYAKGNIHADSDIDLVILSSDFAKMDYWKRVKIMARARQNYEFPMDYFGYTLHEFETASPLSTLGEIKETGRVVFPSKD